mgnify:CR=1 FL=1
MPKFSQFGKGFAGVEKESKKRNLKTEEPNNNTNKKEDRTKTEFTYPP